jgi:hypothetical protein
LVGTVHGGVCALAGGKATNIDVAVIVSIRIKANKVEIVLFLAIFILFFLSYNLFGQTITCPPTESGIFARYLKPCTELILDN